MSTARRIVSIQQPSFMPWLGHFEMISRVDCFLFFDDVQYTKRDWRNRNRIRSGGGAVYLTVPVRNAHEPLPLLHDTLILENGWRGKHLKTLHHAYARAPYYGAVHPFVEALYAVDTDNLAEFNIATTMRLAEYLGLPCEFGRTSELGIPHGLPERTGRVARICEAVNAEALYNGQTAKQLGLINLDIFTSHGLGLSYQVFEPEPYTQTGPEFLPRLSVLDALFCLGPEGTREVIEAGKRSAELALHPGIPG